MGYKSMITKDSLKICVHTVQCSNARFIFLFYLSKQQAFIINSICESPFMNQRQFVISQRGAFWLMQSPRIYCHHHSHILGLILYEESTDVVTELPSPPDLPLLLLISDAAVTRDPMMSSYFFQRSHILTTSALEICLVTLVESGHLEM